MVNLMNKRIHNLKCAIRCRTGIVLPFSIPMVNFVCATESDPRHMISVDDQDPQVMMDRYVASLK